MAGDKPSARRQTDDSEDHNPNISDLTMNIGHGALN